MAIVGARAASPLRGRESRDRWPHGLARAGVVVVSGMAHGIDSAAHAGALDADAATVAVLPGPPNRPYPPGRRALHRRLTADGAAVSELPPGSTVRRWMFPARNRIIAALSAMTVVVEAGERSGALVTAGLRPRRSAGRSEPSPGRSPRGRQPAPTSCSPAGRPWCATRRTCSTRCSGPGPGPPSLRRDPSSTASSRRLLDAIAEGHDTAAALVRAGLSPERGLAALASLELAGYVRRAPGGRYAVIP